MKSFVFLFFTLIGLAFSLTGRAADLTELSFGNISTESSITRNETWGPFVDEMERQLGIKVRAYHAPDYAGVIQAMRFNKVQVAHFGNKSAIEAVDRAEGEVFAQFVGAGDKGGYYSFLITHRDSGIESVDDIIANGKDYTFGNGDPNSTSGFLVPAYYVFARNNIDARTYFKRTWSASHESNLQAVLNKQVDFATSHSILLGRLKEESPDKYAQLRVFWRSSLIPPDPIVWRKDLSDSDKAKIRDFFLGFAREGPNQKREKEIMTRLAPNTGFLASSNRQLLPIRQLDLFRQRLRIESSEGMSTEEKQIELEKIDERLRELALLMNAS